MPKRKRKAQFTTRKELKRRKLSKALAKLRCKKTETQNVNIDNNSDDENIPLAFRRRSNFPVAVPADYSVRSPSNDSSDVENTPLAIRRVICTAVTAETIHSDHTSDIENTFLITVRDDTRRNNIENNTIDQVPIRKKRKRKASHFTARHELHRQRSRLLLSRPKVNTHLDESCRLGPVQPLISVSDYGSDIVENLPLAFRRWSNFPVAVPAETSTSDDSSDAENTPLAIRRVLATSASALVDTIYSDHSSDSENMPLAVRRLANMNSNRKRSIPNHTFARSGPQLRMSGIDEIENVTLRVTLSYTILSQLGLQPRVLLSRQLVDSNLDKYFRVKPTESTVISDSDESLENIPLAKRRTK